MADDPKLSPMDRMLKAIFDTDDDIDWEQMDERCPYCGDPSEVYRQTKGPDPDAMVCDRCDGIWNSAGGGFDPGIKRLGDVLGS